MLECLLGVKYKIWVINTDQEARIYLWENWKLLLPCLSKIVELSDEQAYIRTHQSFQNENRWLGFGRMKWSSKNNNKWTSKYRTKEYEEKQLTFFNTEVWSPDWNYCYKTGENPLVFINVYNYPNFGKLREGILIAMPKKMAQHHQEILDENISTILKIIPNSELSIIYRSWKSNSKFPNRIEDMNPHELSMIIAK